MDNKINKDEEQQKVKKAHTEENQNKKESSNYWFDSEKYGRCKVETYQTKSYIRKWLESDKKFEQIVGSCEVHYHKDIVHNLVQYVKQGLTKPELYEKRAEILQRLKDVD